MVKRKRTKGQRSTYKHTLKTKDRVTRTPLKSGMNSGASEGCAVKFVKYQNIILLYISIDIDTLSNCLF
jgi:hypothetical protein